MRRYSGLIFALATVCALAVYASANASTPSAGATPATETVKTVAATLTPTPPVPTQTPGLPPTPGPDTPTPALPEEGGPPGAVLGGMVYIDVDDSGGRSAADVPASGGLSVDLLVSDSSDVRRFHTDVLVDLRTGRWEVRGLQPGTYRVVWGPPLRDPANLSRTIPPASEFPVTQIETAFLPNRIVTVSDSERILNIDFGMPLESPVAGNAQVQLPGTGSGVGGGGPNALLLWGGLALSLLIAGALAVTARRATMHR